MPTIIKIIDPEKATGIVDNKKDHNAQIFENLKY
jgi:hypothetical protein